MKNKYVRTACGEIYELNNYGVYRKKGHAEIIGEDDEFVCEKGNTPTDLIRIGDLLLIKYDGCNSLTPIIVGSEIEVCELKKNSGVKVIEIYNREKSGYTLEATLKSCGWLL